MTKVAISECGNEANITGSYFDVSYWPYYPNKSFAGGIVGYSTSTIKNCYNTGTIIARSISIHSISQHYKFYIDGYYEDVLTGAKYNADGTSNTDDYYYPETTRVYGKNSFFHVRILHVYNGIDKKIYTVAEKYKAYAYGIGYTTSTSANSIYYCYNTGKIYGGNSTKTVYEFNDLEFYDGIVSFDKFSFSLTFDDGKQNYGYISNTDKYSYCYYLNNSGDSSRGIIYDDTTYTYSDSISKDINKYMNSNKLQKIKIRKNANSNNVYMYLNDELDKSENEKNLLIRAGKATNDKNYFTFDTNIYTHKGTSYSTLSALKNDINKYFPSSSWKTASNINNGERPFLTELYWQYDLDNDSD